MHIGIKMPNLCSNRIEIFGDKDEVIQMLAFIKSGEDRVFDFNRVIPYPDKYAAMDAKLEGSGYGAGGYD